MWLYHRVMSPNDADGMANSVDPDQTAPLGAVWSGTALSAQAYLSKTLGSLRYYSVMRPDLANRLNPDQTAESTLFGLKQCLGVWFLLCIAWVASKCWDVYKCTNESTHDKTSKMACAPSKDSDQPGLPPSLIRAFAQLVAQDPSFLHADNDDSNQTGRMPRQIWVFAHSFCWFCHEAAQILVTSHVGAYVSLRMSRAMRKCVLCHMRTTKAQISLLIRAVWSAPLLFAAKIV